MGLNLIECLDVSGRQNSLVTGLISRGDNRDRADSDPGTLSLFPSPSFGPSVSTSPRRRCFTQRVCRVCVHSFVFFAWRLESGSISEFNGDSSDSNRKILGAHLSPHLIICSGAHAIRYVATIAAPVLSRMLQDSIMHESLLKLIFRNIDK
ncbi:hypothetical protein ALC62_13570 [Cyphomyrmex costatus]|uniref:Uncharacterized protein n=1 Tax=Cyphomyrmex costatus TaxID=456900 RepID=A0A151I9K3_9HYME|nr:hypothetical protein ALC62_13570 [Cyphomyrmex costatus]